MRRIIADKYTLQNCKDIFFLCQKNVIGSIESVCSITHTEHPLELCFVSLLFLLAALVQRTTQTNTNIKNMSVTKLVCVFAQLNISKKRKSPLAPYRFTSISYKSNKPEILRQGPF